MGRICVTRAAWVVPGAAGFATASPSFAGGIRVAPPLCGVGHGGESLVSWGQWAPPGQRGLLSEEEISDILQGWTPRCAGFASPD